MDDDFFRREYDSGPQKRDNLFLWTVFIILLMGGVLATWLGSYYIFAYPEKPRNYKLLMRLHKLDPPKRFEYTAAPPGEFFTPQKLYEKYATMPDGDLAEENGNLLRDYIRNFQSTKNPVPYLVGRFTILSLHELKSTDLFSSGIVALAQGTEYPQVLVEYVYTTDPTGVGYLKETLAPGIEITPERTTELSAILHIEKLDDGRILLTAMPITYGSYTLKNGNGTFSLDPPATLHLEGGVPITRLSSIPASRRNYAAHPMGTPSEGQDASSPAPTPASAQLVRVMPPVALSTPKPNGPESTPAPTPEVAMATPTPEPVASATPAPAMAEQATPSPTMAPVAMATPAATPDTFGQRVTEVPFFTPAPAMTPDPTMATPVPTPLPAVAADHPGVALQPFIQAQPTPGVTTTAGSWKTFRPGQMPRGRLLKISDAASLADRGVGGEQIYLSGQFTVTASGDNHAVLRAKAGVLSALNPLDHSSSSVRVLVEFPAGFQPPAEGSTISRDEMRPFEITDVQRERDGTINVMVREITTAE